MKGQVTFINLMALLVTIFVYFTLMPVLNAFIDPLVTDLEANPTQFTTAEVLVIEMLPFLILFMIVLSGFNMAIPRREGYGGGGAYP
ncbi:MAG: hypothetical protein PHS46_08185 [Candidatus Omnitrophica bacterium]|nr:hypothetical protein [Candidatus Omnitrophota bacterium]